MKSQKFFAILAAGATLTLGACSAGQISQTSDQVPAVNGVRGDVEGIAVRDLALVIGENDEAALKFTAVNEKRTGEDAKLESATVAGKTVSLTGNTTIESGCSLVVDSKEAVAKLKSASNKDCPKQVSSRISGLDDIHPGGQQEVVLKFDRGEVKLNAPIVAHTPEAGSYNRTKDGQIEDKSQD